MRLICISEMEDTMSTKEKILDAALTLFAEICRGLRFSDGETDREHDPL